MRRNVGVTPFLIAGAICLAAALSVPGRAQEDPLARESARERAARWPADSTREVLTPEEGGQPTAGVAEPALESEAAAPVAPRWLPPAAGEGGRALDAPGAPQGSSSDKQFPRASGAPRPGALRSLEVAWSEPGLTLPERTRRLRSAADAAGLGDLDAWARALLWGGVGGDRLQAAEAAIALAPGLPAAQAAVARERLFHGRPVAAFAAALAAWRAVDDHLEALLWLGATLYGLAWAACLTTGFGYIALRGVAALPLAGRDFVGSWLPDTAELARIAFVVSPIVLCAALGGRLVGTSLLLYVAALAYAGRGERITLYAAAGCLLLGLGPLAGKTGAWLRAAAQDATVEAAWSAERGFLDSTQLARLTERLGRDPLATRAVARRLRREGASHAAAEALRAALAVSPDDPGLLNDLGSVYFARGDYRQAIALYRRAAEQLRSAVIWLNLAQAHARLFQMDRHSHALQVAGSLDRDLVAGWNDRLSGSIDTNPAEMPVAMEAYRARLFRPGGGEAIAAALRARWLSPWLAGKLPLVAMAFVAAAVLAAWLGHRFTLSRWCEACGAVTAQLRRRCTSCDSVQAPGWRVGEVSPSTALVVSRHAAVWVPGLGLNVARPGWALGGLLGLAVVGAVLGAKPAQLPDPLAVGALASWLHGAALAAGCALYLASVWLRWPGRPD